MSRFRGGHYAILGNRLDPDVKAYWALGITDQTEKLASKNLIMGLKAAGIWSMLDRLWLISKTSEAIALKCAKTRISMTNTGSATWSTSGFAFNGTTQYIDTNFQPLQNTTHMSSTSMSIGVFVSAGSASGAARAIIGAQDLAFSILKITAAESAGSTTFAYFAGSAVGGRSVSYTASSFTSEIGFLASSRTSSTLMSANTSGLSVETATGSSTSTPVDGYSLYLGALNSSGSVVNYAACTISLAFAGAGLTDAQLKTFDNLQRAYQLALGRYAYTPAASTYFTNQSITDQTEKYAANRAIHAMIHGRVWQACDRVYMRSPTSKAAALACAKSNNSQTDVNSVTWSTGGLAYDGVADYLRGDVAVSALTSLTLNSTHAFIQWRGSYTGSSGTCMLGAKLGSDFYVLNGGLGA